MNIINIKNVIEFYFIINKSNLFIQIKLIIVICKIILSYIYVTKLILTPFREFR